MIEISPNHISHYSPRQRKWIHQVPNTSQADVRTPNPITDIETVIPPSRTTHPTHPHYSSLGVARHHWWARCLTQDVPEMGPAFGLLPDLFVESHLVSTYSELMDTSIGSLLAFGRSVQALNPQQHHRIAAWACGPTSADLSVGHVKERVMDVRGMKGVGLAVPRLFEGGEVVWTGESAIRQVVFAERVGAEAKPNMAVRTAEGTTILRQETMPHPLQGRATKFAAHRMVHVGAAAGPAHAHVEFNLWNERQFATIDEGGKWRVWDIEGVQAKDSRIRYDLWLAGHSYGCITPPDDPENGRWGRVMWGGDVNTVLACDRKRAGIFDIRSPASSNPIYLPPYSGPILDFRHSHAFEPRINDIYTLTSAGLIWTDTRFPSKAVMATPHHRHPDDHTLSLALSGASDGTTTAYIHSRCNTLITTHRFESLDTPTTAQALPSRFVSPAPPGAKTPVSFGLQVLPCRLVDGNLHHPLALDVPVLTAFALGKNLDITQRVYSPSPLALTNTQHPRRKSTTYISESEDDGIALDMHSLSFNPSSDYPTEFGNPCIGDPFTPGIHRTNFHSIYTYAFTASTPSLRTAAPSATTATTNSINAQLTKRVKRHELGVISLLNLHQPSGIIPDLPAFQATLTSLLCTPELSPFVITDLRPPSEDAGASMDAIYRALLDTWVAPLPATVPTKVRLRREALCRMLATEMWMSSVGVHLPPTPTQLPPPPPPPPLPSPDPETNTNTSTTTPPQPEPLLRIRTYANVTTLLTLPTALDAVLAKWVVGENPHTDFEFIAEDEDPSVRRRRAARRRSLKRAEVTGGRPREDVERWAAMSQQAPPTVVVSSQVVVGGGGQSQGQAQAQGPVVMSQVERGKFGARVGAGRKKRKTGF